VIENKGRIVAERVGFVLARDEPKASCGVPEFSLDANDRACARELAGEGGIRTQQDSLDSVSYRFYNANVAVNARNAVAPCPPETLESVRFFEGTRVVRVRTLSPTHRSIQRNSVKGSSRNHSDAIRRDVTELEAGSS
jgi:hypothetical protein